MGDALLLMSDGLPEMVNPEREVLNYPRIKKMSNEAADQPAADIVRRLQERGRELANGIPQGDNGTLAVVNLILP